MASHIHPPKVEVFDVAAMTNTDPKGVVRRVDEYRVEPFGLYMARRIVDHPRMDYVESWLLPRLGLRVTDWRWLPGQERDQDYYVDIVDIAVSGARWTSTDHYLDLIVRTGRELEVLDSDEMLAAVGAGLLDPDTARRAMERTYRTVEGIARCGYDLPTWLAEHGVTLRWRSQRRRG
ncbi:DUF402 domain-containing protein [Streptoalloteichus hindustanus]|nr:DUF402 domain-containing protein [Streptoalloteichus hindustanus]